ncbi:MAG: hypothetical protein ABGZ19_12755 [Verrucomicrobiales bacterium]
MAVEGWLGGPGGWGEGGGSRRTFFKSEPRGGVVWWFRGLDVDVLSVLQDEK